MTSTLAIWWTIWNLAIFIQLLFNNSSLSRLKVHDIESLKNSNHNYFRICLNKFYHDINHFDNYTHVATYMLSSNNLRVFVTPLCQFFGQIKAQLLISLTVKVLQCKDLHYEFILVKYPFLGQESDQIAKKARFEKISTTNHNKIFNSYRDFLWLFSSSYQWVFLELKAVLVVVVPLVLHTSVVACTHICLHIHLVHLNMRSFLSCLSWVLGFLTGSPGVLVRESFPEHVQSNHTWFITWIDWCLICMDHWQFSFSSMFFVVQFWIHFILFRIHFLFCNFYLALSLTFFPDLEVYFLLRLQNDHHGFHLQILDSQSKNLSHSMSSQVVEFSFPAFNSYISNSCTLINHVNRKWIA